jgi:hypothetical protein
MERMEQTRSLFVETIKEEYSNYCKATGQKESTEGLTIYLVNKNIVEDRTINRFLAVNYYPKALEESNGIKKLALYTLEDIVCLSYSSLRIVIQEHLNRFRMQKRVNSKT